MDRPRYQLWPTIKRAATPTAKQTPDSATTSATIQTVSRLREGSPKGPIDSAMRSKHKEGILPRRRKISVPELGLGLMTTVQETHMDSRRCSLEQLKAVQLIMIQQQSQAAFQFTKGPAALQVQAA